MGQTPDRRPGVLQVDEEGIDFAPTGGSAPTSNGQVRYVAGVGFRFFELGAEVGLSGSGLTEAAHALVRQLIHLADDSGPFEGFASGAFEEILPSGDPFPTSAVFWTSAAKTHKIVEETVTYNANKTINTVQWKVYDTDGSTVLVTATDTYTYSGIFVISRTRVLT